MGEETDGKAAKGNFPDSENIIKLDFVDGCTTKYWMYTLNEYSLWYVNYISKWAYLGEKKCDTKRSWFLTQALLLSVYSLKLFSLSGPLFLYLSKMYYTICDMSLGSQFFYFVTQK